MIALENFMLPCLNKKLLGFECMGCGGQRAVVLLFQGDFIAAFKMYPALYSLLLFGVFLVLNLFFKIKYSEKIKIILVVLNIAIIVINYMFKLIN